MSQIRLISFDLDNTLWSVDAVIRRAEAAVQDFLGANAPQLSEPYGSPWWRRLRHQVMMDHPQLSHDVTRLRLLILETALIDAGFSAPQAQQLAQAAFDCFIETRHQVALFADTRPVLATLARHYRLVALTNGNASLARLGLMDCFAFQLSAADAGASKPAPAIFRLALQRAGVAAAQVVHIGDHPRDDIEGANRVGMLSIWMNYAGAEFPAPYLPPTAIAGRLGELPELIATL